VNFDVSVLTLISKQPVPSLNRASILLSNHIQSFLHCIMDFPTVSMVTSFHMFLIASLRSYRFANGSRQPSYTKSCWYPKCSNLKDWDLENMMPIQKQLWSLECSVIETVASLLQEFKVTDQIKWTTFRQGDPTKACRTKVRRQLRADKNAPLKKGRQQRVDKCAPTKACIIRGLFARTGGGLEHRLVRGVFTLLPNKPLLMRTHTLHL